MAPIASTLAISHTHGVTDAARARELYKYYQPNSNTGAEPLQSIPGDESSILNDDEHIPQVKSNVTSSKVSSPDTALTSFAQLVAWRTGAQRAMISVIDSRTQYFIAESTKTLDLFDCTKYTPGDELWIGCSEVDKSGRLCEKTVELPPSPPGKYPAFIVSDLSKDNRFNTLPFVSGPPFLKFYAGTPLITKRGIAIGSLFVVDEQPRALTESEIHFMGTMATTIMRHLEMNRDVEERRKGMKMSRGLASFVEGRGQLSEDDIDMDDIAIGNEEGQKVAGHFQTPIHALSEKGDGTTVSEIDRKEKEYSSEMLQQLQQAQEAIVSPSQSVATHPSRPASFALSDSSIPLSSSARPPGHVVTSPPESETSAMKTLFSRAANIIRESFEVDGGAVFYDAQKGFGSEYTQEPDQSGNEPHGPERESSYLDTDYQDFAPMPNPPSERKGHVRKSISSDKIVEILGFSTAGASSIHGDSVPDPDVFNAFDERSLHLLLRRYPRGKLWTVDEDGVMSSSDDDMQGQLNKSGTGKEEPYQRKQTRGIGEARFLLKHFPTVRQLIFVPLWDAARSRWLSGCFVWSNEPTRILSKQVELSFLSAFGNSVMAECSRIDTEIADQKKGDFIGSISHELRSPLHGILASAEFLCEEITEGFAKSLVETIDSCGRTLLDTINHILDFSKINHFEKNWRRSRRGGRPQPSTRGNSLSTLAAKSSGLPMINLFADVDISIISEEVVEGVFAGHVFQNLTASNFDHIVSDPRAKSMAIPTIDGHAGDADQHVNVILDMDMGDYTFTTQPGAFKRVIMNLLGNSLKYTSKGYVRIKLETLPMEDFQQPGTSETIGRSCIILKVEDTGKGISSDFLRSKLFTPFAQENSLSSGTGLGLSIVRSIVTLLEGEIQINSRIGVGTEVKITLPLLREMPKTGESSISGTGSAITQKSTSLVRDADESISLLRSQVLGKRAYLHGFDLQADVDPIMSRTAQLFKASVTNYLENWYGLSVMLEQNLADIIIADDCDITTASALARPHAGKRSGASVIVLRSHFHSERGKPASGNVAFVAKPVGPLKLARVILQSLNVHPSSTPGLTPGGSAKSVETNDLSHIFDNVSLSPHGGKVLDNSRMAAGSDNARKAIESPAVSSFERPHEFPFPSLDDDRPPMAVKSKTMFADKEALRDTTLGTTSKKKRTSLILTNIENSAMDHPEQPKVPTSHRPSISLNKNLPASPSTLSSPRLLLVDDNKINLRLLRTFMRKRAYSCIDEAENGLEAVNRVKERGEGYDIIFMDISMPVLDGFGATMQIREIERARQEKAGGTLTPALVIALTGLASSKDQSEAFRVGVDLFLTKPVSFKEVGMMLDNWVSNREKDLELEVDRPVDGADHGNGNGKSGDIPINNATTTHV